MRIITGSARGTRLQTPDGLDTRPTSERVKEGVFSAINFEIAGKKVLDLFCGSGQMALEALSRGAETAVLVDSSRIAVDIASKNAQKAHLYHKCRILCCDYKVFVKSSKDKFNLIFLDPPYADGLMDTLINELSEAGLLAEDAIIVCETSETGLPSEKTEWQRKEYRYGKIYITIFRLEK